MSKAILQNYTFNKTAKTVTFNDYLNPVAEGLMLITNITKGIIIYQFNNVALGGTFSGNVLTLTYDTSAMANTDKLQIIYDDVNVPQQVGNVRKRFRDGFKASGTQPDPTVWTTTNTSNRHIITAGGNSSGAGYLRISLNPLYDDSEFTLTSKDTFKMPLRVGFGVSISQRISGQEIFAGMASDDGTGNAIDFSTTAVADFSLSAATVTVTTNVATVQLPAGVTSPYTGGDRISLYGFADSRMNVGPVVLSGLTYNSFTFPVTIANGTYVSTNAYVRLADPLRYAYNAAGYLWENVAPTNASTVSRRNGSKFRTLNTAQSSTTAVQANLSPFTDAFNSTGNFEQEMKLEEVGWRSYSADSLITMSGINKYTQGIPDETLNYHIHVRARNLKGLTIPIAQITNIAKTGTTTATVTTDVAHGLTTSDWVQIYGVRDFTNFPNLAASTAVASIVDATNFTIVIGSAVTATSAGGAVWRVQGSIAAPGVLAQNVQSISRTSNVLTVVGSAAWATPLPGEYFYLYGMDGSGATYNGAYKVQRVSTTILDLESVGSDFASINCGGAVIRMTDVRLHFTRVMDYSRLSVEVTGGRGNTTDTNNSVPVAITGATTLPVLQSVGVSTTQWSAAGWGGFLVNDVLSAAITATATTAATSPGSVVNIGTYVHSFNVIVTAVSGTTPTLDVGVEESMDNGTNWTRIYDFERITATGAYTSPLIMAQRGTRYRYVQTVAGTTPSFTRAINRVQFSSSVPMFYRWIDRSVSLTTLNSTTPVYTSEGCDTFSVAFNIGAAATAPQLQLEGSEDSTNWYSIGTPLTATASSTVVSTTIGTLPKFVRGRVSTAGVGVTAGYISIKAIGR